MKLVLEVILSLAMVGAWVVVASAASHETKLESAGRAALEVAVAASAPTT